MGIDHYRSYHRYRYRQSHRVLHFSFVQAYADCCRKRKNRTRHCNNFRHRTRYDVHGHTCSSSVRRYFSCVHVRGFMGSCKYYHGTLRDRNSCGRHAFDSRHHSCHGRVRSDSGQCGRKRGNERSRP